jgi:hypothetical protein
LTDDIDLAKEYSLEWSKIFDGEFARDPFIATGEIVLNNEHGVLHRIGYELISALPTIHPVEAGIVPESGPT